MWAWIVMWLIPLDTLRGLAYEVGPMESRQNFKIHIRIQSAERFGWLVLYRRPPRSGEWREVRKVYVDRWQLPKVYLLQDDMRAEVGWAYRVVWRSGQKEEELGMYYPWGRLPVPPQLIQEQTGIPILRCVFAEPGKFLLRGYNSFGEEVFTYPIEVSEARTERYQLPLSRKGRYLVRLVEPQSSVSLAEIVVAL